ncbi:MAG: aldo/keto reductase [Chloroflexi bacterium]|nr:aldo/keto reductase [Chloroflexota bacterium]
MRYKLLGRTGLRVSELCLGTMTFGEDWGWGASMDVSRQITEKFREAGGNFIDTSCNYTNGTSEKFVGEFTKGERDWWVIATKYTLIENRNNLNTGGNHRKNMMRSVEGSLRRLQTEYIDLLYLHMWDFTTAPEEVLRAVDDLIRHGKVLHFAFSDTPAWVVSYAVAKADDFGWTRPCAMQVPYSLADRAIEREVAPMARFHDMALLPWGVLEAGVLTGKYSDPNNTDPKRNREISDSERAMGEAVVAIAREIGRSPAQVALNWVRQQSGTVIPILGCRKVAHLEDNLGCLEFSLSDDQMAALSKISGFRSEFPMGFLRSDGVLSLSLGNLSDKLDIKPI